MHSRIDTNGEREHLNEMAHLVLPAVEKGDPTKPVFMYQIVSYRDPKLVHQEFQKIRKNWEGFWRRKIAVINPDFEDKYVASKILETLGTINEIFLTKYIAARLPITKENFLSFETQLIDGSIRQRRREVDIIVGDSTNPKIFLEVKSSSNSGKMQLAFTMEAARSRWPDLKGVLAIVDWKPILLGKMPSSNEPTQMNLGEFVTWISDHNQLPMNNIVSISPVDFLEFASRRIGPTFIPLVKQALLIKNSSSLQNSQTPKHAPTA